MTYLFGVLCVAFVATFLTRALPYILFKNAKNASGIEFLQKNIPPVIMIILIIYAINATGFDDKAFDEILALFVAIVLQIFFKNALLSIALATGLYMFLVG